MFFVFINFRRSRWSRCCSCAALPWSLFARAFVIVALRRSRQPNPFADFPPPLGRASVQWSRPLPLPLCVSSIHRWNFVNSNNFLLCTPYILLYAFLSVDRCEYGETREKDLMGLTQSSNSMSPNGWLLAVTFAEQQRTIFVCCCFFSQWGSNHQQLLCTSHCNFCHHSYNNNGATRRAKWTRFVCRAQQHYPFGDLFSKEMFVLYYIRRALGEQHSAVLYVCVCVFARVPLEFFGSQAVDGASHREVLSSKWILNGRI